MNDNLTALLTKYDPDTILTPIMEHYDPTSIRGGSFVVIDADALNDPDISRALKSKRGPEFLANLHVLAKNEQALLVSALKTVRPTSAYMSELPTNNFDEADLVVHDAPGMYRAPITVPCTILKTVASPNDIYGYPIPDKFVQKMKITKGDVMDDEYNNGRQPKGTLRGGKR